MSAAPCLMLDRGECVQSKIGRLGVLVYIDVIRIIFHVTVILWVSNDAAPITASVPK